jgi:hypothetical protein
MKLSILPYVFQELVSGMNLLAKFIIYPQLISDDIPELGYRWDIQHHHFC